MTSPTIQRALNLVLDYGSAMHRGSQHEATAAYAQLKVHLEAMEHEASDLLTIAYMSGHARGVQQALSSKGAQINELERKAAA